ncbi:MAG: hypothetical protein NVS9B1_13560 [Candidatus Dormibacteraceae bacterium]
MAARIRPLENPEGEVAELLVKTGSGAGPPLNIFATLAHHPLLLRRFNALGGVFIQFNKVPSREREIVILRVGWRCGAVYEFGQHTRIGRQEGLTEAEILALATEGHAGWSGPDQALIAMADELCADNRVGDRTWAALAGTWSEPDLIELLLLAGFYRMASGFLNSVGVELEPGTPGWPVRNT